MVGVLCWARWFHSNSTFMSTPRILAFGGSLRNDSFNQKLAAIAAEGAREAGAEVTLISLRDFPMPLFDQDLEAEIGKPAEAKRLKALFLTHQGLLIASPEYNSSYSAALKNAVDWVSRGDGPDEPPISALAGKSAVLMAASPGGSAVSGASFPFGCSLATSVSPCSPTRSQSPRPFRPLAPMAALLTPNRRL